MSLRRAARVILVGAPGVGKGTQSTRLLKRFPELAAISTGDLLRDNVRNRTPLGIKVEHTMKSGNLVPDSLIIRLILNELSSRGWVKTPAASPINLASMPIDAASTVREDDPFLAGAPLPTDGEILESSDNPSASFLLDGFPRTVVQAQQLSKTVEMNLVINIKTPLDLVVDRISNRLLHAPSGRIYNTTFNPPKVPGFDDITGDPLTRRPDDDPDTFRSRWHSFMAIADPLCEFYAQKGVLWQVEGETSDAITPKIIAEIEKRFG